MAPQTQDILPTVPSGVVVTPMLSSKLNITAAGVLVSSGSLDSTDGGVFTVMLRDFTGTVRLTIDVLSKYLCQYNSLTDITALSQSMAS